MKLLRSYPVSVLCYIVYTIFCCLIIYSSLEFNAAFEHIKPGDDIAYGNQAQLFGIIYTSLIAVVFIAIMILNALFRKTARSFYLWMCLLIALPLFVLIGISYYYIILVKLVNWLRLLQWWLSEIFNAKHSLCSYRATAPLSAHTAWALATRPVSAAIGFKSLHQDKSFPTGGDLEGLITAAAVN